ncbi:MAG: hypothetical protein ABFD63_08035, partial [Smithella sp.]
MPISECAPLKTTVALSFFIGDRFEFPDAYGKHHSIEIGPLRRTKDGSFMTILGVDYHPEP